MTETDPKAAKPYGELWIGQGVIDDLAAQMPIPGAGGPSAAPEPASAGIRTPPTMRGAPVPTTASGPQTGSERLVAIAERTRAELAWLEANNRGADHIVMGRALTVGDLRTMLLALEEAAARDEWGAAPGRATYEAWANAKSILDAALGADGGGA